MSKKRSTKISKKDFTKPIRTKEEKEWPVVVYMWAFGLTFISYLIAESGFRTTWPHPIHWLLALAGGILGIGAGWLWYRWRGDVF